MPVVTDSFDRADAGTLGANWTEVVSGFTASGYQITSNRANPKSSSVTQMAIYTGSSFGSDQYAQSVGAVSPYSWGIVVRMSSGGNGYSLSTPDSGTPLIIGLVTNGAIGHLQTITGVGVAVGDTIKFVAQGNVLRAYKNGSQIGTDQIDSTYTTGSPGIMGVFTGFDEHDNFEGGDLVTAPTLTQIEHATGRGAFRGMMRGLR